MNYELITMMTTINLVLEQQYVLIKADKDYLNFTTKGLIAIVTDLIIL